ncbi:modification methylase [Salegentibacter salinarum]|uniref:site-specific DNA-methyltransferase (adenine-specific) n=1 Tax=Salegentibacter salinarum TaxID=447422 RepID=A0A2N0U3U7_9FLAO|nr:DNA adenine methylase [Salegentibacter salinarum]PKD21576.1 modification methylase [Salegentibacter salinarum]SKB36492.1 adenine-specific DNA-methyltransferase [Salegentibacter salinarum]
MNYIGSKHKLGDFIKSTVKEVVGEDLSQLVFCDLFAGTGSVGRKFKTSVKSVIANDVEYYSYVLLKNYIENHQKLEAENLLAELNNLEEKQGFIFEEYSENGKSNRLYFSETNGMKIDAVRQQIENWKLNKEIGANQYFFLLASLLESADKVANTASVYGAFLKKVKLSAQKELVIRPANFQITKHSHRVFQKDANQLIKEIEGDILYLDPPYNARQYGANYHILNTIAKYDTFAPQGKTGLRDYYRSNYCSRTKVKNSFQDLLENVNFRYIFFSYNNEGLMPSAEIKKIMSRFGNYDLVTRNYQRFKADKTENRNHTARNTTEYLHILEKK